MATNKLNCLFFHAFSFMHNLLPLSTSLLSYLEQPTSPLWGIKVKTGRKRAWLLSTFQFSTTFLAVITFSALPNLPHQESSKLIHLSNHRCQHYDLNRVSLLWPFFQTPSICLMREENEGSASTGHSSGGPPPPQSWGKSTTWQNQSQTEIWLPYTFCYSVSARFSMLPTVIFLSLASLLFQIFSILLKLPF